MGSSPELGLTPIQTSPPSSSTPREPWGYESPSGEYYERICSVIGLYDFIASDADRLSFRKQEILEIVRKDESGWWGAVRGDGSEIGWIPAKFVRTLSDDVAHRVSDIRERTRIPEFSADSESARSAPPLSSRQVVETQSSGTVLLDNEPSDITQVSTPPSSWSDPSIVTERPREPTAPGIPDHIRDSPTNSELHGTKDSPTARVSPNLVLPIPQGPNPLLKLDKSLPASPDGTSTPGSAGAGPRFSAHRRNSSDSAIGLPDSLSLPGPSTFVRAQTSKSLVYSLDVPPSPFTHPFPPNARPRPGKVLQLTGDDSAQAFHNARQAQANLPWYLKHRHSDEEIKLEFDGTVKAGTLSALVEHLVVDSLRENRFSASR